MKRILVFTNESPVAMGTALEENAVRYAERPAVLYEDVRYSHREFNESVNRYARYFAGQGLRKGDVAAVLVDNRPELLMIIGAISELGGVSSLINPNQRGRVLVHSTNLTREVSGRWCNL